MGVLRCEVGGKYAHRDSKCCQVIIVEQHNLIGVSEHVLSAQHGPQDVVAVTEQAGPVHLRASFGSRANVLWKAWKAFTRQADVGSIRKEEATMHKLPQVRPGKRRADLLGVLGPADWQHAAAEERNLDGACVTCELKPKPYTPKP